MKQDIRKDRKYGLRLKLRIHAGIKHESVEEGPNHHKPLFQISRRLNTVLTVAGHRLLHQVLTPHAVRSPDALRDLLIAEAFSRNFEPQSAVSAGQAILDLLTDALLNLFAMDIRIRIPPDLDSVNVIIKPPVHNRFDNVFLAVEVVVDVPALIPNAFAMELMLAAWKPFSRKQRMAASRISSRRCAALGQTLDLPE